MSGKRGSHGGAWKVAYADFVTAMMALFLVLWIVAMSQEMKESIAGYFRSTALLQRNPSGVGMLAPVTQLSRTPARMVPPQPSSTGDLGGEMWATRAVAAHATLRETASTLQRLLHRNNDELTDIDAFRFEFTNDGFRLQAMDRPDRPLFEDRSTKLTDYGRWVLGTIAWELERYPFQVEVEGHTQGGDKSSEQSVDQWDLSTQRAMVARQFMQERGIRSNQFLRVVGYADRQPLESTQPDLDVNRRITVFVRLDPTADFDAVRKSFAPTPDP